MFIRLSTWEAIDEILKQTNVGVSEDGKKPDVLTKAIWWTAGLVGSVGFFGSFVFLGVPLFTSNVSWLLAAQAFVAAQWMSSVFMNLHESWNKATAWLTIWWYAGRKKELGDKTLKIMDRFYGKAA